MRTRISVKKSFFSFSSSKSSTAISKSFKLFSRSKQFTTLKDQDAEIQKWQSDEIKKRLISTDVITLAPIKNLQATFGNIGKDCTKDKILPPNWHLLYFLNNLTENELASDGYETTFAPPFPYTQRMWAGGSLQLEEKNPLKIGQSVTQQSQIEKIEQREGSRGKTIFVTISKKIHNDSGLSISEIRTLAYMKQSTERIPSFKQVQGMSRMYVCLTVHKAKSECDFQLEINPTSILLFRYSALTFNSHKIHYDHKYTTQEEHYPGLLVHGPLTATLLLELIRKNHPDKFVTNFSYRALSPLFEGEPFNVCGKMLKSEKTNQICEVWAKNAKGHLAMSGTVSLASQ